MLSTSLSLFRTEVSVETKSSKEVTKSLLVTESIEFSILKKVTECLEETKAVITGSSSLPGYEHMAEVVDSARKRTQLEIVDRLKDSGITLTESLLLRLITASIKTHKMGNCLEFSLYCHNILIKAGIKSEIVRIKGGDHVFLVVNRSSAIPINEFMKWNQEAFVVDPFFSNVYKASEILILLKSCLYNEELNKVSYIPFDSTRQVLDNTVLSNLLEDWKKIFEAPHIKRLGPVVN